MDTPLGQLPIPLLLWYREHARTLPWRSHPTAYRVWISEIMLQQTRVAAVLDYYRRFLEAAPTVEALAALPEDQLMKLWQGLGYYSRARNLQKAARQIVEEHGGLFPNTYDAIHALPGVGDYTAGRQRAAGGGPNHRGPGGHLHPGHEEKGHCRPGGAHPGRRSGRFQPGHDGAGSHRLSAQWGTSL